MQRPAWIFPAGRLLLVPAFLLSALVAMAWFAERAFEIFSRPTGSSGS
jgi:hypothetical protein